MTTLRDTIATNESTGDYHAAIRAATEALTAGDTSPETYAILGTQLMNAGLLDMAEAALTRAARRRDAVLFLSMWIPHYRGQYAQAIAAAGPLLADATNDIEAAHILHRLGRVLADLARETLDRPLANQALETITQSRRLFHGRHNLFVPLAELHVRRIFRIPPDQARTNLADEVRRLAEGLGSPSQAHVHLMDAFIAYDEGRYFSAVDHADAALSAWASHPYPHGVMTALSARAESAYKLATDDAIADAATDSAASLAIAERHGFRSSPSTIEICRRHADKIDHNEAARLVRLPELDPETMQTLTRVMELEP